MLSYFLFCLFHLAFSLFFTMIVNNYFYSILILFSYFLFGFSSYFAFLLILYRLLFCISSCFVFLPLSYSLSKRSPPCFSPVPFFPLPSLFFLEKFCSARNCLFPTAFCSFFFIFFISICSSERRNFVSSCFLSSFSALPHFTSTQR